MYCLTCRKYDRKSGRKLIENLSKIWVDTCRKSGWKPVANLSGNLVENHVENLEYLSKTCREYLREYLIEFPKQLNLRQRQLFTRFSAGFPFGQAVNKTGPFGALRVGGTLGRPSTLSCGHDSRGPLDPHGASVCGG